MLLFHLAYAIKSNNMHTSTILDKISAEDIYKLFGELNQKIEEIKSNAPPAISEQYLTRAEVAKMLKCDLSTIHNWTKKGKLKPVGIGNRVYFKLSDIEASLISI